LPHVDSESPTNSLERMKSIDLMVAEVSFSSTGLGIEIGWANALDIPVVCIHKSGTVPSTAISGVSREVIECEGREELKRVVREIVNKPT